MPIPMKKRKPSSTKWLSIYTSFIEAIKNGSLKSGERLPSSRILASLHRCHRFTVMEAMHALAAEGWVEAQERSAYVVSSKIPITSSQSTGTSASKAKPALKFRKSLPHIDLERTRYRLEFWGGQPDLRLFPMDEFRSVLSAGLRRLSKDYFSYGHIDGIDFLQAAVRDYLRRTRTLLDKEILITNGSQEAIHLISGCLLQPGDKVAVEAKGYPPAWRAFENTGAKLVPIEVDDEGIRTGELAKQVRHEKIKLIYTTPLHQYPTTVTLSPRRRQELIQIAENHRIPILEDDYDHEFHYLSPPPNPLSTETSFGIYVCSFSKILFPGSRLGVIACDSELKAHLMQQKFLVSRQTDCMSQIALACWIKDGGFERHVRRMRRLYEKRFYCMLEHLELLRRRHNINWNVPSGGMSIWLNLMEDSTRIAQFAKDAGILFQEEQSMNYSGRRGTYLRIGFATVNEQEIKTGMQFLDRILAPKPLTSQL